MGNRILKESICMSDTIDKLSWFEEVFFYRLIVNADDFGRFDARFPILKARLFPLKEVTDKQIFSALDSLQKSELLLQYEWDGKPIIQVSTWDHHQSVRNKKSKYPAINGNECVSAQENIEMIRNHLKSIENIGNKEKSNEINCSRARGIQSNPIQFESNTNPIQYSPENPPEESVGETGFDQFWSIYPKKKSKGDALKAWKKINPSKSLLKTILDAVSVQKGSHSWIKDGGQYIPHPATWLRSMGWEDEVDKIPSRMEVSDKWAHEKTGDTTAEILGRKS